MNELILSGTVIYGEKLEPRKNSYIVIEGAAIKEIGEGEVDSVAAGIISPGFVNAHTHIGDSCVKDLPYLPLDDLVKPPQGIKHKILAEIDEKTLIASMRASILQMIGCGTVLFADFREGGASGAKALRDALSGLDIGCKLFGRDEIVPEVMDGVGISGASDMSFEVALEFRNVARSLNLPFAIHAGERDESDILPALTLCPDHLVHMVHAEKSHIKQIVAEDIPVVVCIRSNLVTGVGLPPLRSMLDAGVLIGIGTDNVMLNSPDILLEMEFLSKIYRLDDRDVLKMATINGIRILEDPTYCGIMEGGIADLVLISDESLNMRGTGEPVRGIVRRASSTDLIARVKSGLLEVS